MIIGNLDKAEFEGELLDNIEGQARFMRAFCYFYLTRWFGEIQIITYENQSEANTVPQAAFQEIYDFIVADLKIAEEKLPVSFAEKRKSLQRCGNRSFGKSIFDHGRLALRRCFLL